MMAAVAASRAGAKVILLEKNRQLGNKLRITGGGRCNISNAEPNQRELLSNYGNAKKALYSPYSRFGVQDSLLFFKEIGIDTKTEAKQRVFPVSERASDVANALVSAMERSGVVVHKNSSVDQVKTSNSKIDFVSTHGADYSAGNYILATGGTSRPDTGSTGDGFAWLKTMGHSVNAPTPDITPLAVEESFITKNAGTKITRASISFFVDGQKSKVVVSGDILLTHFGISGPAVLNTARNIGGLLKQGRVVASLDSAPGTDTSEIDATLIKLFEQNPKKQLNSILPLVAPSGFASVLRHSLAGKVDCDVKTSEVSKFTRQTVVDHLKELKFTITGLMGLEKAVVADGGVDLAEIDTKTMRSKVVSNLYVTGDLLHINRPSGGFSLQLCWTTGHLAGLNAAKNIAVV